jgi:hypothetical protein
MVEGAKFPIDPELEAMRAFILSHQVDEAELHDVGRIVASNVSLRARGLKILTPTEQMIVEHIAKSLYYSSKYLNLPMPDGVGFIEGEEGIPNRDGDYTRAENIVNDDHPAGLINYSLYYLTQVARCFEGLVGIAEPTFPVRSLATLSSHEVFHTWQRENSTREYKRDMAISIIFKKRGNIRTWSRAWNKTPTERGAIAFEEKFGIAYIQALARNPLI